jgi:penicillin-binding protein 1C
MTIDKTFFLYQRMRVSRVTLALKSSLHWSKTIVKAPFSAWMMRISALVIFGFVIATWWDYHPPAESFMQIHHASYQSSMTDRQGTPLFFSYPAQCQMHDKVALHNVPEFMQRAFIVSEDKRFYQHYGADMVAKAGAIWQHVRHDARLRGASTITEQVVRLLHPRERTVWAKWMESVEAIALEQQVSKADILEFYLNCVPYAAHRRGVMQAAAYYFDRSLSTLSLKEMLALVVLVRAPSAFDLYKANVSLERSIARLAQQLGVEDAYVQEEMVLSSPALRVDARHFVRYARTQPHAPASSVTTSLDGNMQRVVQELLQERLTMLARKQVSHAAGLVVEHRTGEILAYVSLGSRCVATDHRADGCEIDMVREPRQPGSALKPFLYAMALEKGWNAATLLEDAPYAEAVGRGMHHFHNYSRQHYGMVRLREALGNSLNIPAIHTVNYVTPARYLQRLHALGFSHLQQEAHIYDVGLALGNGEVSLLELTRAYATLARQGQGAMLSPFLYAGEGRIHQQLYSAEVASLVGNILSDPWARAWEFGRSSVLNLPSQTAVKTGTSTDYRDAWAMGYNADYTVGVWMGNADYRPMKEVTGSTGPALALRAIFNELHRHHPTKPLYLSPTLQRHELCMDKGKTLHTHPDCARYTEYFIADTYEDVSALPVKKRSAPRILRPTQGMEMALDPRIPRERQRFMMRLNDVQAGDSVEWQVDDVTYPARDDASLLWQPRKGKHRVKARVMRGDITQVTPPVHFVVK